MREREGENEGRKGRSEELQSLIEGGKSERKIMREINEYKRYRRREGGEREGDKETQRERERQTDRQTDS